MDDFALPHFEIYSNKHFKWQNEPADLYFQTTYRASKVVFHHINYVKKLKSRIWRAFLINENGSLQSDSFKKADIPAEQMVLV